MHRSILTLLLSAIAVLASVTAPAQLKADDITGTWLTRGDKKAKIAITRNGNTYDGKIVYLSVLNADGSSPRDEKNPDKAKRTQTILGLQILKGFKFDKDEWNHGEIYDPESGKTYSCTLSLKDPSTLKVRGYIGISLLGRTEIWTKVQ